MAQGSPASAGQMDTQEIALRRIQVAEAASVAAQSAAEASNRKPEGDKLDKNWFLSSPPSRLISTPKAGRRR